MIVDAKGRDLFIVDNSVSGWTGLPYLEEWSSIAKAFVTNGLLLRSDVHRLFDKGYVAISGERRIEVTGRLKEDYSNGRSYYPLHGQRITVPADATLAPSADFLQWHQDNVYRA